MTTQQMKEEKQDKVLVNLTASLEKLGQSVDKECA